MLMELFTVDFETYHVPKVSSILPRDSPLSFVNKTFLISLSIYVLLINFTK